MVALAFWVSFKYTFVVLFIYYLFNYAYLRPLFSNKYLCLGKDSSELLNVSKML